MDKALLVVSRMFRTFFHTRYSGLWLWVDCLALAPEKVKIGFDNVTDARAEWHLRKMEEVIIRLLK